MEYIKMKQLDEYSYITTNVPNESYPFYDATATYNAGDIVVGTTHKYECLADNTTGVDPQTNPVTWLNIGPVNNYAMLDGWNNTQTTHDDTIHIVVDVSDANTLSLFGLHANSVRVTVTDNTTGTLIHDEIKDLSFRDVSDWFEWTYQDYEYLKKTTFRLPMAYDARVEIWINTGSDSVSKCGNMVIGRSVAIGCTLIGAIASKRSNTIRVREADGRVYLKKGQGWDRISAPVLIDSSSVDDVIRRLDEVDGEPTLFIGDERDGGHKALSVFGFYRDFDVNIGVVKSTYTLEIEGVG